MFHSTNPFTGELLKKYNYHSSKEIKNSIQNAQETFLSWSKIPVKDRGAIILKVKKGLEKHKQSAAENITREMGKPISQSLSEIEKCQTLCDYYAENASELLQNKTADVARKAYVTYEPLGVILGIMPWNFPFWQVFRFAIPTLMAGNAVVLKHALNVPECALLMEKIFQEALGAYSDCFQNVFCINSVTENIISHKEIKGVSLTGSTKAGLAVAQAAAKFLKPVILELGGSNALVVFKEASIQKTVAQCLKARFMNNGQSCIAGKRLLIDAAIEKEFTTLLTQKIKKLKIGDPMDKDNYLSVLAKEEFASDLKDKLSQSIKEGAKLLIGGTTQGAKFEPTLLSDVTPSMPAFKEETFGPLLTITTFANEDEAINLINETKFGLGASLFSENTAHMESLVSKIKDGAVFINSLVKSIPSLPFGGSKLSGLGRELAEEGIKAFTNCKTVVIEN